MLRLRTFMTDVIIFRLVAYHDFITLFYSIADFFFFRFQYLTPSRLSPRYC